MKNPTTKEVNAKEVVKALQVLCGNEGKSCDGGCSNCPANQFRATHPSGSCDDGTMSAALDLIESLQADNAELRKANGEYQDAQHPLFMALGAAQRRADAALWKLQSIDWVGSGAKARIEDAIAILTEGGVQAGEESR